MVYDPILTSDARNLTRHLLTLCFFQGIRSGLQSILRFNNTPFILNTVALLSASALLVYVITHCASKKNNRNVG